MAGADHRYDALFEAVGVIRVREFSQLLNTSQAFAANRVLGGRRVAVLTSTGGAATLVVDSLEEAGLFLPVPDHDLHGQLRAIRTDEGATLDSNPIDVTLAGVQRDTLQAYLQALVGSPLYDAVVVVVGTSSIARPKLLCDAIKACLPLTDKPIVTYVSPHAPNINHLMAASGIPAFSTPEGCAAALAAMAKRAEWSPLETGSPLAVVLPELPSGPLDEAEARALFSAYGITGVREKVVDGVPDIHAIQATAAWGDRVVLKVLSKDILHKTEVGGVALDVPVEDLAPRIEQMRRTVRQHTGIDPTRFLIQEHLVGGVELIVGMDRDDLGTTLMVGAGGLAAELQADFAVTLLPDSGGLAAEQIYRLLQQLRCFPLLTGFRGKAPADMNALLHAVAAFSCLGVALGDRLVTAEINPLIVMPDDQGVRAVDAVAVLSESYK